MPPPPPHPPSSSFLLAFISEQTSYAVEYPVAQFGSAVLAVSPPRILPTLSLLGCVCEYWRGSLDAVQALPNSSPNTGVLSPPFQPPVQAQYWEGCCRAQPDPINLFTSLTTAGEKRNGGRQDSTMVLNCSWDLSFCQFFINQLENIFFNNCHTFYFFC